MSYNKGNVRFGKRSDAADSRDQSQVWAVNWASAIRESSGLRLLR
jgi:hypothetical protein